MCSRFELDTHRLKSKQSAIIDMNITQASISRIVTTVKGYYINHVICFEFNILIMVSSTILNTTTVLAYLKSSQLRKKTSYFLIMLLSTSDLGTSMRCSSMHSIILLRDMLGYESSSLTLPYTNLIYVLGIPRFMTVTYRKHSN